jgi:small subunit ribosomal protein S15e
VRISGSVLIILFAPQQFNLVEVKPEMVGHYTGEFSISYQPVKHGRPGIGSTNSSRFIPLKVSLEILASFFQPEC